MNHCDLSVRSRTHAGVHLESSSKVLTPDYSVDVNAVSPTVPLRGHFEAPSEAPAPTSQATMPKPLKGSNDSEGDKLQGLKKTNWDGSFQKSSTPLCSRDSNELKCSESHEVVESYLRIPQAQHHRPPESGPRIADLICHVQDVSRIWEPHGYYGPGKQVWSPKDSIIPYNH